MSTVAHTPGPWIAAASYSSVVGIPVVAQSGKRIANASMPGLPAEYGNDEENLANARLIAAAPSLLSAAMAVVEACNPIPLNSAQHLAFAELTNAIHAAKGGA